MSDDNDSGGIIGAIISIFILAAIWPYLLALIGLYIAYIAVLATLEWIAQNLLLVVLLLLVSFSIYTIFHYRIVPKAWKWIVKQLQPNAVEVSLPSSEIVPEVQDLAQRKFIPSSNLYCYWCTKKLGIKAWERNGKYYCDDCLKKL